MAKHKKAYVIQLPLELIDRILDFADPASHLKFACACRALAGACEGILGRHKQAHEEFRVISDVRPMTIPEVLAKVFEDPIAAWHLRSVEIWGRRASWDDWKEYQLYREDYYDSERGRPDCMPRFKDGPPQTYYFDDAQMRRYMDYLREDLGFSGAETARAWEEIQGGFDGVMKLLIFSICPRLDSLKFVGGGECSELDQSSFQDCSLKWLMNTIWLSKATSSWPPGLRALREVDLGVDGGRDFPAADLVTYTTFTLASLMHLPGIKKLYLKACDDDPAELPAVLRDFSHCRIAARRWGLKAGTSSVEHLFFDNNGFGPDFAQYLLAAPRNLKTLALREDCLFQEEFPGDQFWEPGAYLEYLATHQSASMESVMFYNCSGLGYCEPPIYAWKMDDIFKFRNMRHMYIRLYDIKHRYPGVWDPEDPQTRDYFMGSIKKLFGHDCFRSMEALVLGVDHMMQYANQAGLVDIAIAKALESGSAKSLKALHLRLACRRPHGFRVPGNLRETRTVAKKRNIDVIVNDYELKNLRHVVDFPKAPEKYDLASGLDSRHPIESFTGGWAFDPAVGRWTCDGLYE